MLVKKSSSYQEKLAIPISPVFHAALRAIYASASTNTWISDIYGRPQYQYKSRDGYVNFFCETPPSLKNIAYPRKLYAIPRQRFIYAGSLRKTIQGISVETADVFLILMTQIAGLGDPARDIAKISLEEIAMFRGVRVRHGSARILYEELKREVLNLADLRLKMVWRNYRDGGFIYFGKERSDRLLDIVDVEYKKDRKTWANFHFRCGQALSHFLKPNGLRWIGYYSSSLLKLSPYHEAFTKKLGTYWIIIGTPAGKKGDQPRATPRTILDFCGENINWRNPGQTVDAFTKSRQKLTEIGVWEKTPILEPPNRNKGYFINWLDSVLTVKLSENLWRIIDIKEKQNLSSTRKRRVRRKAYNKAKLPFGMPETAHELQKAPTVIKQFRAYYFLHQTGLARELGISRQTLSNYERGLHVLPKDKAIKLLQIMLKYFNRK